MRRGLLASLACATVLALCSPAVAGPPSVVFILLDTTRADRFGIGGNPRPTTPALDALAASGIRFARHFASSHATRPSMPQLMSGRYYHHNILAPFETDADPREMSFAHADDTSTLLPAVLRARGYVVRGVSAHQWVAPDSPFGKTFDGLELLPFGSREAHGDARPLVDRAIALWEARDPARPLFLYLHFMDMHIPRRLPEGAPRFPVAGADPTRFRPSGEPTFGKARRRWSRHDARDFTPADRAYYASIYDTRLQYTDEQIARLLSVLRRGDPDLGNTIVVVTADHGEELGEDGRVEHLPSFADGVQHVPWIVAGGPVAPGARCDAVTEHVDVLPSLLALLDVAVPAGVAVDGTARLTAAGRLTEPCGGAAAFYAWEDYRAVRLHHYVFVTRPEASAPAACEGRQTAYHLDGPHRRAIPITERRRLSLARRLEARLAAREATFRATRYDTPGVPFLLRADLWELPHAPRCVLVDSETSSRALSGDGWTWTGRGLTVPHHAEPLPVRVAVPPGHYTVDVAATPVPPQPWFFGFARWLRHAYLHEKPSEYLPIGNVDAPAGTADVALPLAVGSGHHVLGLRFTPPGATTGTPTPIPADQRDRLRALGYVE